MSDKKIAHTEAELIEIFNFDKIHEKYFSRFLTYYKVCFDELYGSYKDYEDDDFDEEDSVQAMALSCTNRYIKPYLQLIERGHSETWAHDIAYNANDDLELDANLAYSNLQDNDSDLARKNLLIHTKSIGGDEYFEKYYMHLFDVDSDPSCRIETAENYSKEIKKQLAKGKSGLYAHEYADLRMDYDPIYCEDYAFAYEKALQEQRSEGFARLYADKYASSLIDIKIRFDVEDHQEMIDFAIDKIEAYMKGWLYATENEIKDITRFASLYKDISIDTYYADAGAPNGSEEEIETMILNKVLERFNK